MARASKGSAFERQVAKILSLWISEGKDDSWVWRTSQSGGRATTRAKNSQSTSGGTGDLTYTDHRAAWFFKLFSVELKCGYKGASLGALIDSKQKKPLLLQFWDQCERDRELSGAKYNLLIVKRDRKFPLVVIQSDVFSGLVANFGAPPIDCITISFTSKHYYLKIIRFDEFFDWIDSETLEEMHT